MGMDHPVEFAPYGGCNCRYCEWLRSGMDDTPLFEWLTQKPVAYWDRVDNSVSASATDVTWVDGDSQS